jgi:hypothetical protein
MKFPNLVGALASVALVAGATTVLANDSDASEMRVNPETTLAWGENVDQPLAASRNVEAASAARTAAPLVISERPPRPPVSMSKSAERSVATGDRLTSRHIFPPRGFPRW